MPSNGASWIKRHALLSYFLLTFTISWSFALPLALAQQGWGPFALPLAIHYLASFGPFLAALLVTWIADGPQGLKLLVASPRRWQIHPGWLLFCIASPIALFALAIVWNYIATGAEPNLWLLGDVDYLPHLGIIGAVLLWMLTFGVGEEVGWRGFALPRLQQQ